MKKKEYDRPLYDLRSEVKKAGQQAKGVCGAPKALYSTGVMTSDFSHSRPFSNKRGQPLRPVTEPHKAPLLARSHQLPELNCSSVSN